MKGHLTAEQISSWMAGEHTDAAQQHVRVCRECRAEIGRFETTLTEFRDAVHQWSDAQIVSVSPVASASRPRRFAWAFAAAVALLAVWLTAPFLKKQPATAAPSDSDAALLSSVHSQVSRTVPSPMEPLTRLIPSEVQQ